MKRAGLLFTFALFYYLFFSNTTLPAQVVKLENAVTALSVNAGDTILAAADSASISTYSMSDYTLISDIRGEDINRSLFYQEQNAELLITLTNAGKFMLYRPTSGGKKAYGKTEEYVLSDYAEGKLISCNAFSKNTNYSAAAFTDFSIQIHFKLRFIKDMITRPVEGHQSEIYGLEFSNDEKYLASVSKDGTAYIWACSNYKQAARIDNIYTESAIPVYFTADSVYIISMEDSVSLRISDLQGQKVARINTGRKVIALLPLADPDTIAVLNDKNEIVIYSIRQQKAVGVMRLPETEISDITAFDFCHTEKAAFAGCASGAVYKLKYIDLLKSEDETPKGEPHSAGTGNLEAPSSPQNQEGQTAQEKDIQDSALADEASETDKPFSVGLKTGKGHFLTLSALMGFLQPEKTNFQYLFGVDACYRNTFFTAPVYIGLGLRAQMALPKRSFPVQYENFNGKRIAPPFLWMGELYIPVGIEVVLDRRGYAVLFEEAALTARLSALARPKVTASKPFFSYGGRLTTGISVKFFTFAVALNYDSLWKLFPEIMLGGRIDFKSGSKTKGGAL